MSGGLSEAWSAEIFDVLPCGVIVTDVKGTILRVNKTFCAWVGLDASELVGQKKLQELFTMGGRIFHQTHWAPALQMQGSLAEVKFDVRRKDGAILPMMLNAVRKSDGGIAVDVITLTVAEERNKYERELVAAKRRADELVEKERAAQLELEDRALFAEQMIAIVSHDLRNPLSAILMGATILERGDEVPAAKRQRLTKTVMSSARNAQRLIEDLLDFTMARVGRGLSVSRKLSDVHVLVARTVESLALAFPGRVLEHVSVGEGESLADDDRVAQLLGNLVSNAMAYGDPTRPVTVTSAISENSVRLAVHNWGEPIPLETQTTMFHPMVRGDVANGSARSVGLGLFIVRAIATAHGGDIQVVSTAEAGTSFTFTSARV